ncbi:hypothetical protein FXF51_05765 [Nonomuraea sp. PA05]|uniref:hypothetical protein n=1 Tax=Nonomuraea sp. PA05 TaxID=2604466 RepID=UPI0011D37C00|nr:hypothetical protein [Nonomuraea sp. PA05]TYB69667.1 hypothetical protein FXF51_05765 [Nonomuraea sp. PA05]
MADGPAGGGVVVVANPLKKIRKALTPKPRTDEQGRDVQPPTRLTKILRQHMEDEVRRQEQRGGDR